ncbi:MAG TPA: hypothetical protein VFB99_23995, partial [Vicinamibacterales bacterium]|nr:hypothetical protein [Vicinamibacterales bacterium]
RPKWSRPLRRIDWDFSDAVLRLSIGSGRVLAQEDAFFRCQGCNKVHTTRGLVRNGGRCKCGGSSLNDCVGALGPWKVLWMLLRGD